MFADSPYVVRATEVALTDDPLDPEQIVSGDPRVASHSIAATAAVDIGVWEHSPGVSTDVEADEVFVVLSGRATIVVQGGPRLEIGPGDVGVLTPGARTTWTVHETLRKVYVIPG